ncbi:carbohydrate ABC transporter permease [Carboxydochorda subterranea]|uniref:Carbohydrate ABC transporter permease n=1 Tax=Carboxydichorda subterranea TaxID=3109565 RepID=A0ABZ1BW47_9FIRM|nr:carbohydrate ABC transporter permease [Limnochorda sp. L945t]WRP16333.1 carbohydrate ABC transporter permease [Limnochorda sp. L945t]
MPSPDAAALARRRWARAGAVYLLLLAFSLLFIGPFLFAVLSSLKDNPTEWPPRLDPPQLEPRNWAAAYRLGKLGGGSGWFGAFAPGAVVPFEVTYRVTPEAAAQGITTPDVRVPRRVPGAGAGAVRLGPFASDFAEVSPPEVASRLVHTDGSVVVTWRFTVRHTGDETVDRLPLDVLVPRGYEFVGATLSPNRVERLGRVQSWNSITPGVIPYVLYNYTRVFRENYSRTTGKNLFLTWIGNSLWIAVVKVLTTLAFASLAGYALARLRFPGRQAVFLVMLFSMMVPGQVTFISNYLVLRDGIFGLSRLWGMPTLLNSFTGLILSGLVGASAVFIMKQFFESLPRELDEAARIDGASPLVTFYRVVLPLARPALGALTILTFQGVWNEFFWPLVVLTSPQDKFTLPVGLLMFRRTYGVAFDWGPLLAGAVVSALPIVVLFVVFQRYFVEGISFSGLKG